VRSVILEYAQLLFSLATLLAVMGNVWVGIRNTRDIKEVSHNTNSISQRLEAASYKGGFAEGVKSEQDKNEKERNQ
jgi:hypothetical protein